MLSFMLSYKSIKIFILLYSFLLRISSITYNITLLNFSDSATAFVTIFIYLKIKYAFIIYLFIISEQIHCNNTMINSIFIIAAYAK